MEWGNSFCLSLIDPRTNDWPLISSPVPGLTIIGLYLYFVNSWGPRFMKDRKPFQFKNTLIVYNFVQVLISVYLFTEVSDDEPKWSSKSRNWCKLLCSTGHERWMAETLQLEMSTSWLLEVRNGNESKFTAFVFQILVNIDDAISVWLWPC